MFSQSLFQEHLLTSDVGRVLVHQKVVTSTMDVAREMAAAGAGHGTLVLADEQTHGRGRRGRSFFSPPGNNLYFTMILRLPLATHRRLPLAVPLATCLACVAEGANARIKWPNDIWIGDLKVSGMLIDSEITGTEATAFPGIGVNVNGNPATNPELASVATSLGKELGREVAREPLLARICNGIEETLRLGEADLAAAYASYSMILGREVMVTPAGAEPYMALAREIAHDGTLVVECVGGEQRRLQAADVSVRRLGA
jgi:BirA family biotin operon repressor/biotin-[acetyl-CoA-carboxylase] ligase